MKLTAGIISQHLYVQLCNCYIKQSYACMAEKHAETPYASNCMMHAIDRYLLFSVNHCYISISQSTLDFTKLRPEQVYADTYNFSHLWGSIRCSGRSARSYVSLNYGTHGCVQCIVLFIYIQFKNKETCLDVAITHNSL